MQYLHEQVLVRGKSTEILTVGEGPPLLYLHGAGGEVAELPFFDSLAERFRVFVPAHPGFGESSGLDEIDSIEDLVFHYTDLIETLEVEAPAMVGLSLGGWLAAEFATRYSDRLSALVLIAPVGMRPPAGDIFSASPRELRELVFSEPDSELARSFVPDAASPGVIERAARAKQATARVGWNPYLHNRKLADRLYRVAVPTLVLAAGADRLVPVEHCRLYADGIADSEFVCVDGAGHALPLERPEECAKIVSEFLAR
ncbi:MAG: alpha/beta hydrolase [Myxococcales bacterium]|nr:alpha/beta hydrolase [Myxococcales bacterium]